MKKLLAVSLVSVMLVGCGSGDNDSPNEKKIGLDIDLSEFKSSKQPVAVTDGEEVSNGDEISVNEFVTGTVGDNGVMSFQYYNTAGALLPVMVSLASPADNLDLAVTDEHKLEDDSYNDDSNELLVFEAKPDVASSIHIQSDRDENASGKAFTLTLEEATRQGLGLSNDEYAVNLDISNIEDCDDTESLYEYEGTSVIIFNFKGGYMRSASRDFKFNFTEASGHTLTGVFEDEGDDEKGPYKTLVKLSYTVDPDTGAVTGSRVSDLILTDIDEGTGISSVVTCNNNSNYDGNIIL